MARPPIRLLIYIGRTLSGMIITANREITPVQSTAYQQVRLAAILRFFILGEAISRYTCARVSNPLIDSSECPKAMMITTIGICIQNVPLSQPCALSENTRLEGLGAGGRCQPLVSSSVIGHQMSRMPTMTVVICMMRSALPLDSCTPLMFCHQK